MTTTVSLGASGGLLIDTHTSGKERGLENAGVIASWFQAPLPSGGKVGRSPRE